MFILISFFFTIYQCKMFFRMIVLYYPRLSIGFGIIDSASNTQIMLLWFWKLTEVWRSNPANIMSPQYISNEAMPNLVKDSWGIDIGDLWCTSVSNLPQTNRYNTMEFGFNKIHFLVCSGILKLIIHYYNSKQYETEIEAIHHSFNSYDILLTFLLPNAIYNSVFHWNFWKLKLATASIGMKISQQPNRPHGHLHTLDTHTDVSSLSLYIHIYWGVNNAFYTIKMRGES